MSRDDDKVTPIRGALSGAAVATGAAHPGPPPLPGGDGPPGKPPPSPGERAAGEIWHGCPVKALGKDGKLFFYLDTTNQLQEVDNHTKDRMRGIFGGRNDWLMVRWPSYSKSGDVTGWKQEDAAAAMQRAAAERGIFRPHEKLRGVGAWPDEQGGVILHCGDRIVVRGEDGRDRALRPGDIDGHIYPADAPAPTPAVCNDAEGCGAAEDLAALIATWNWARPEVDAHLLLGQIVAMMFGGALRWRPTSWVTGDKGTGKSTLDELIDAVLGGPTGVLRTTDATEAGLRSIVRLSTLPVVLDEAEAEADNRKMGGVVKLARQASSGGMVLRGSADHKGAEFRVRSAFLFSSILIPPLGDQDISRIAVLELQPFAPGSIPPKIVPAQLREAGRRIRRRVFDGWARLHDTLELYRQALIAAGHTARGADQYGTLLALADLALWGGEPEGETTARWAARLDATRIHASSDESHDWQRMLNHLFTQRADVYRSGTQHTVGELIGHAADLPDRGDDAYGPKVAGEHLRRMGIAVEGRGWDAEIMIASQHAGLSALFRDTQWAGGVWRQSARRIPGSHNAGGAVRTMAGGRTRVTAFKASAVREWLTAATPETAREPADIPF